MSLKGGYKIIDLKGIDVTQSTMMIEGIYESIESNYGKPLLISGIVIDGVEKDDVFVQATLNGTAYEFKVYDYTIQIQDTDAVGVKSYVTIEGSELTSDENIELKNGDLYYLHISDENYQYHTIFNMTNCEGVYFGLFFTNLNATFESFKYDLTLENKTRFIFKNGDLDYVISVSNNKIYITIEPMEL